jgi:hypothetical protein
VLRVTVGAIPLTHIGWKAQAALAATGGRARVLAPLSASIYLTAGNEVVWLGHVGGTPHPRAMLSASAALRAWQAGALRQASSRRTPGFPGRAERWGAWGAMSGPPISLVAFDAAGARLWPARLLVLADVSVLTASARALLAMLRERPDCTPEPLGLGALLVGRVPPFPLDHAVAAVADLARACDDDKACVAVAAADRLLGLGPGLTPAGDDLVGGVLFARNLIGGPASAAWREAASALVERARGRTNLISLALLSDLAVGHGHEPLLELADALGHGTVGGQTIDAIRRLGAIGHSSGWDMLAGFLVGIAGPAALGSSLMK